MRRMVVGCSTGFTPILLDVYSTNMSEIKNSKPVRLMHRDGIFNTVVTEESSWTCDDFKRQLFWLKVSFCREEGRGNDLGPLLFLLCSLMQIQK